MRLIDGDALADVLTGIKADTGWSEEWAVTVTVSTAVQAIAQMPTIEPKKGKWIHDGYDFPHGNDWIHCSICGKRGINVPADLTNYCPNCGARMEE